VTTLQHLVVETKTLAIPRQQFDSIAAAPTKGEDGTRGRVLVQHLLRQSGEARYPFAHIGNPTGEVDPNAGAGPDHAPSTVRISRRNSVLGNDAGTFRLRPPGKLISIVETAKLSIAGMGPLGATLGAPLVVGAICTGTNPTTSPPSSPSRPSRSAARHW
jgi:hypothetical protein